MRAISTETDGSTGGVRSPNLVLVLVDDMGYSDLGCYGGEVRTPAIDGLARGGVRLAHFYNTARCSPSRASLLTGLHPHQTGIGILTNDDRPEGYPGSLNGRCVTAAELLRDHGYATAMCGKWHLSAQMTEPDESWPTRRGFEHFFGSLTGCGSYYQPKTLFRGEENAEDEALAPDFFYTDAISDEAVRYIHAHDAVRPFFLYVAYTAPHWPLHALEDDIGSYDGVFDAGWDELRERRLQRLVDEGLFSSAALASGRDPTQPAWVDAPHRDWQLRRMQTYAAQLTCVDRGVERIVAALSEIGALDDTLIILLSDNGASAEDLPLISAERFATRSDILPRATRAGERIRVGNSPDISPGPEDTYSSYGRAWANLSNTPFRFYKRWVLEGGIAAPFIVHWPAGGLATGSVQSTAFQLTDVLPTMLEAAGVADGSPARDDAVPREGTSMLAALRGGEGEAHPLFWEHTGNAAVRLGSWKLVRADPGPWELYDIDRDPAELDNRAADHPDVVTELVARWNAWAEHVGVIPWDVIVELYRRRGASADEAAG